MNFARLFRAAATSVAIATSGLLGLLGAACDAGAPPNTANIAPGPMPAGESWNGVYFHPIYGYLHLVESGSQVIGRWKRTNQSHWGELNGTVSGNVLHYSWKEHQIGMVGPSATTRGKGYFVYKMDEEGRPVLEGQFGLNDNESGSDWRNVKQARVRPNLRSIGGDSEGVPPGGF